MITALPILRVEGGPAPLRVGGPFTPLQQLVRQRLQLEDLLVGADRLPDGEDPDRGVALLDDVAKHGQVRVVGYARLPDPAQSGADVGLGAVDSFASAEVELVEARAA